MPEQKAEVRSQWVQENSKVELGLFQDLDAFWVVVDGVSFEPVTKLVINGTKVPVDDYNELHGSWEEVTAKCRELECGYEVRIEY